MVADSITRTRHHSDREPIGQGMGNMAAGLIDGVRVLGKLDAGKACPDRKKAVAGAG